MRLSEAMKIAEEWLEEAETWQIVFAAGVVLYSILLILTRRRRIKTHDYYRADNPLTAKVKAKMFPPPYPNGWFRICGSSDIDHGKIKSVSALGREFVVFRGKDGEAGVLDAFCPHLGAHLGQGGIIENGLIRCPFHHWKFDTQGRAQEIPYCKTAVPERAKTKSWLTKEFLGMIFIWFHAEPEKQHNPDWELEHHKDCLPETGKYLVTERQMEFNMHILEMSLNSQDYYHFQTLHAQIPLWPLDTKYSPIRGVHEVKARYFEDADPKAPHCCLFRERMKKILLFNRFSIVPEFFLNSIDVNVVFEGPSILHFKIDTVLGTMRLIKTLLPCPARPEGNPSGRNPSHHVNVQSRWFADPTVPRPLAYIMSILAARALEQDRECWENKTFRDPACLVAGDGPYVSYKKWYVGQFYSKSSRQAAEDPLDW